MKHFILSLFLLLIVTMTPPAHVFAVTTQIVSSPPTITNGSFTVTVNIEGAGAGTNYLRLELYKEGDTHYFGETFNGSSRYNGSDYAQYLPITIIDGKWSGDVIGQIGDGNSEQIDSSARYFLRVRRYTGSGSYNNDEAKNSAIPVSLEIAPSLSTSPAAGSPTQTVTLAPTLLPLTVIPSSLPLNGVYLSEAFVYPSSDDHEWIELYNANDFTVSLDNWFLDDIENGGGAPRAFSLSVPARGYGVVDLSSSLFNNNADTIRLLNPSKDLKDSFSYTDAKKDISFGRLSFASPTICPQTPSKGTVNGACVSAITSPSPTIVVPSLLVPTTFTDQLVQTAYTFSTASFPLLSTTIQPMITQNESSTDELPIKPRVLGAQTRSQTQWFQIAYVLLLGSLIANGIVIAHSSLQIRNKFLAVS